MMSEDWRSEAVEQYRKASDAMSMKKDGAAMGHIRMAEMALALSQEEGEPEQTTVDVVAGDRDADVEVRPLDAEMTYRLVDLHALTASEDGFIECIVCGAHSAREAEELYKRLYQGQPNLLWVERVNTERSITRPDLSVQTKEKP